MLSRFNTGAKGGAITTVFCMVLSHNLWRSCRYRIKSLTGLVSASVINDNDFNLIEKAIKRLQGGINCALHVILLVERREHDRNPVVGFAGIGERNALLHSC